MSSVAPEAPSTAPGAARARLRTGAAGHTVPRHLPAVAGYVLLTVVFFWPAVADAATRMLSEPGDGSAYLWNMWDLPGALGAGEYPFSTDRIFHPLGALTAFNTNMPLLSFVSWPLQGIFGLGMAANILQYGAVIGSGVAAYLLALHVCGDRRAAFVAGAAFTLAPYRFAHLGHFSLTHMEFLPLGLLAGLRLYEAPTRRRAVLLGVVVGLTFLTDLYYTVFLLIALAVLAAWRWRVSATAEMAVRLAQSGGAAVVVALPLLVAMGRELVFFETLDPLRNWANADNYSADLLSWVTPSVLQRVWGSTFAEIDRTATGGERLAFAGFVILALAAVGAVRGARRQRGLWVALAAVFFVLSLGPFLHVNGATGARFETYGVPFSVPLPYFLLHHVPVINGIRVPGRFSVMGILALDVLAAVGLARLAQARASARWFGWAVPGVALALVLVEFWPRPVPTFEIAVPAAYQAVKEDRGDGAVLEIPLQWRTGFAAYGDTSGDHTEFLYYATRHGKPMVAGMAARFPERRMRELLDIPVYRQIVALQQPVPPEEPVFTAADLRDLRIGYVVFHRDRPRPAVRDYLLSLDLEQLADDGLVEVYKVP